MSAEIPQMMETPKRALPGMIPGYAATDAGRRLTEIISETRDSRHDSPQ
jgi:hypothetical protein